MSARSYRVNGMTCGHCQQAIEEDVGALTGVTGVEVDLDGGVVTVTGEVDDAAVRAAVDEAGYEVVGTV